LITDKLRVVATLCKGCGVCAGICPCNAITMERDFRGIYTPDINASKCSRCMLCTQACPAMPINGMANTAIRQIRESDVIGPCLESYSGYSATEFLRYKAASGGIATALLLNAFERETIDAALVVMPSATDPFESRAEIIKDGQKLNKSLGSRYMPVEYSKALKQLIQDNSVKRVGIVGLPCHIEGIKRACSKVPKLRKKVAFTIGLFCKQTKDLRFTDMILAKMGVKKDTVQEIKFRGEGWPGAIHVKLKDGSAVTYPYEKFNSLWGTFSCAPISCLLCTTPMGEVADISVGDAWLDVYRKNKIGVSSIVVRSKVGQMIVDHAVQDDQICLDVVSISKILNVQPRFVVIVKRVNFANRLRILCLIDPKISILCVGNQPTFKNLSRYMEFLWILGMCYVTSSMLFRRLFPLFPDSMLKILSRGTFEVLKIFSKPVIW